MFDFLTPKAILTILHIFGAILGAGSAYVSDSMFFLSVRDSKFIPTELKFLNMGSKLVWVGTALLFLSGLGLFFLNPEGYMNSSKFLAKMTVVVVIIINGIIFGLIHMPLIEKHKQKKLGQSEEFRGKAPWIIVSGAISIVSWTTAVVLGVLHDVPFGYMTIMGLYALAVTLAVGTGLLLKDRILFGKDS